MEAQLLKEQIHLVSESRAFVVKFLAVHHNGRGDLDRRSCRICCDANYSLLVI